MLHKTQQHESVLRTRPLPLPEMLFDKKVNLIKKKKIKNISFCESSYRLNIQKHYSRFILKSQKCTLH